MKNSIICSLLLLLAVLFGQSCTKELLDKKPLNLISDAQVWDDPGLTNAYVANLYGRVWPLYGLYASATVIPGVSGGYEFWPAGFDIVVSGEACVNYAWQTSRIASGTLTGDGSDGNEIAYIDYSVIRDINSLIVNLLTSKMDENLKKQYASEARFLRAFVYFEMAKRYGGMPIILTPQSITADSATLFVKRNKEQEVYDMIGSECDAIATDLAATADGGRPTKYAALALKSKAMLYAASIAKYGTVQLDGLVGIPAADANKYWQASLDASKAIKDAGVFQLYTGNSDKALNYQDIFLVKDNSEVILAKKYAAKPYGHNWDDFENPQINYTYYGSALSPSLQMVDSYDMLDGSDGTIDWAKVTNIRSEILKKDPRCEASLLYNRSPWFGKRDTCEMWSGLYTETGELKDKYGDLYNGVFQKGRDQEDAQGPTTGFLLKKFLDRHLVLPIGNEQVSTQDWLVFRYAETLLNFAEASFELNGANADNLKAINDIRNRAGVAPLAAITLDKIRHERRIELAFEGHTFYDLRRWRTAEAELNTNRKGIKGYWHFDTTPHQFKYVVVDNAETFNHVFKHAYYYLPIGANRINTNPNLIENPGY